MNSSWLYLRPAGRQVLNSMKKGMGRKATWLLKQEKVIPSNSRRMRNPRRLPHFVRNDTPEFRKLSLRGTRRKGRGRRLWFWILCFAAYSKFDVFHLRSALYPMRSASWCALLRGSGVRYPWQVWRISWMLVWRSIRWPGETKRGFTFSFVRRTAPTSFSSLRINSKLPFEGPGYMKSFNNGVLVQPIDGRSNHKPIWDARPMPLGWAMPWPS